MVSDGGKTPREWPAASFLGQLTEQTRRTVVRLGTARSFAAGEIIMLEGARSDSVVLLLAGLYKVVGTLGSDREALVAIRVGGDIVGELGLADGQSRSATVKAVTSGSGRRIGPREYHDLLGRHPDARQAIDRAMAGKLRSATTRRVEFATFAPLTRLARVLSELAAVHGTRTDSGVLIGVSLAQPELAALIGVAEQTVQRLLARLRRDRVLDTLYRKILVLDEERLAGLAQP